MEAALKLGHLDCEILRGEKLINNGDVPSGLKLLLGVISNIREFDSKNKSDHAWMESTERFNKCIDLIQKGGLMLPNALNRPIIQQHGRQLVNVEQLVMPPDDDVFLSDIVGMKEAKLALIQAVLVPNLVKKGLPIEFQWRGILLFGPSGVGKTKVVRALANSIAKSTEIKITFLNVTLDQVCGSFHGETEKNMQAIFKAAESKSPTILLFDEVDALCTSRENDRRHGELKITNHFLSILDGLKPSSNIVVIGTTNKIYTMDNAFYRRFQKMIYVELPGEDLRADMLQKFLARLQPYRQSLDIDFKKLAETTAGYSPADLLMLVSQAAQDVRCSKIGHEILFQMEQNQQFHPDRFKDFPDGKRAIQNTHLICARQKTRPTNSTAEIYKLETFASMYCDWNGLDGNLPGDCECCTKEECVESPAKATWKGIQTCFRLMCCEFFGDFM